MYATKHFYEHCIGFYCYTELNMYVLLVGVEWKKKYSRQIILYLYMKMRFVFHSAKL